MYARSSYKALCLLTCLVLFALPAKAQTFSVDQPLSFGTFVLPDFSSVGQIIINPSGTYSVNSNIYIIDPPARGEYSLINFAPSSVYTVSVPTSVTLNGIGPGSFTLDNITVTPNVLITDSSGDDTFSLSGRLRSSGTGISYGDGGYSDVFTITLNF